MRRDGPSCLRKLILGSQASSKILNSRAIPDGQSPKRSIPMEIDESPRKKVCLNEVVKESVDKSAASPSLKPNRKCTLPTAKRKSLCYRGKVAAKLNWDGVDNLEVAEGGKVCKKDKKKQPLISSLLPKKDRKEMND